MPGEGRGDEERERLLPFFPSEQRERKKREMPEEKKAWLGIQKISLGWLGGAEGRLERPSGGLRLALGHQQRRPLGKRSEEKRINKRKGKTYNQKSD